MLAEKLVELGCRIVQANTDGLFVLLKKSIYDKVNNVCREWEQLTKLTLEEDRFEAMYQYAINDYIAVKEGYTDIRDRFLAGEQIIQKKKTGELYKSIEQIQDDYIKQKGMFITKVQLGKGLTPKIIPEAVIKYFVDGIPVEDTIKGCKDIKKFLMAEYMKEDIQRTNRFYASTNGGYLWKWKQVGNAERQYQNMLAASGVTLLNKFDDKPIEDRKINYRYYLRECYKIIEDLKPRQLSLF